jgi:hypothetical protein
MLGKLTVPHDLSSIERSAALLAEYALTRAAPTRRRISRR